MTKEELFQLAGVSYRVEGNKLTFLTGRGDSKVYFQIEEENLDDQIESCSIDFFLTFTYLQDALNAKLDNICEE
jgi:hypothetical protein